MSQVIVGFFMILLGAALLATSGRDQGVEWPTRPGIWRRDGKECDVYALARIETLGGTGLKFPGNETYYRQGDLEKFPHLKGGWFFVTDRGVKRYRSSKEHSFDYEHSPTDLSYPETKDDSGESVVYFSHPPIETSK